MQRTGFIEVYRLEDLDIYLTLEFVWLTSNTNPALLRLIEIVKATKPYDAYQPGTREGVLRNQSPKVKSGKAFDTAQSA